METVKNSIYVPVPTPLTDEVLGVFTIRTKEGINLNEVITQGQREIMECILGRQAPDGSGRKRVHITAHTRYGKSLSVGAAIAVRASMKKEPWAIVAPTKEQAQIIMDYVIWVSVNDPIISQLLKTDTARAIKEEYLTQRRSRDHITFLGGGEVRTYTAGSTMGFGSPNVVLDEAGLIDNDYESRVFRMLGDHTDNFYVKIGNPWYALDTNGDAHHFAASYEDTGYYSLNIDWRRGIAEGRLTEQFVNEVRKKPNFDILYENLFPDTEEQDKDGYYPLFTHRMLKNAVIEQGVLESIGAETLGGDPADGGSNESVICLRSFNLARIAHNDTSTDVLQFADKIAQHGARARDWNVDRQGVGTGTIRKLQGNRIFNQKLNPVNAGEPVPQKIKENGQEASEIYANLRAYIFFKGADWVKAGGKLEKKDGVEWRQLLAIKWKNDSRGRIKIISKDELHRRKVHDLGVADAFSFTFVPPKPRMGTTTPTGGVKPYYPEIEGSHAPVQEPTQEKTIFPNLGFMRQ